ncbi:MAG: uracil-DNA glycosylase [Desulfobulbaceae bacterium]|nr:uracil-DNA glycosylase [Desulfobulbaceae bacterium]
MKNNSDSLRAILEETRKLLVFHKQCGLDYPLTDKLQGIFETKPRPANPILPGRLSPPPRTTEKQKASPAPPKRPDVTLKDLKKELGECRRCGLDQTDGQKILGEGKEITGLPLFIVCDLPEDSELNSQLPIAGEPRELLIKMLAAINLSLNDVYLTNTIKCKCSTGEPAAGAETATCFSYLQRQIEILKPKIICTMGPNATQTLLKTKKNIFSKRGKFHTFLDIPLMPTLHPAFLLKHPEMKKGSWHDLQMIQKKLAEMAAHQTSS